MSDDERAKKRAELAERLLPLSDAELLGLVSQIGLALGEDYARPSFDYHVKTGEVVARAYNRTATGPSAHAALAALVAVVNGMLDDRIDDYAEAHRKLAEARPKFPEPKPAIADRGITVVVNASGMTGDIASKINESVRAAINGAA